MQGWWWLQANEKSLGKSPTQGHICPESRNNSTQSLKWAEGEKVCIQITDLLLLWLMLIDEYISKEAF